MKPYPEAIRQERVGKLTLVRALKRAAPSWAICPCLVPPESGVADARLLSDLRLSARAHARSLRAGACRLPSRALRFGGPSCCSSVPVHEGRIPIREAWSSLSLSCGSTPAPTRSGAYGGVGQGRRIEGCSNTAQPPLRKLRPGNAWTLIQDRASLFTSAISDSTTLNRAHAARVGSNSHFGRLPRRFGIRAGTTTKLISSSNVQR